MAMATPSDYIVCPGLGSSPMLIAYHVHLPTVPIVELESSKKISVIQQTQVASHKQEITFFWPCAGRHKSIAVKCGIFLI